MQWKNRQITHQSGQSLNRKATWIWQIGRINRSQVNGMPAVFTANIEDLDVYHGKHLSKVVQFTVPYQGDEDGLPNEDEYEKLINRLFKILAQLTALPNVFFAGHFICNHQAKMHFLL